MGRITSNIGLVTGINIKSTVDQLIAVQARSRDLLTTQNSKFDQQKTALSQLTAQLIGLQFSTNKLATNSLFDARTVTSSNETALTVSTTGEPQTGQYQFTPIQLAQSQQLQSSRFASKTSALGAGTFAFRFGGYINTGVDLDLLNGGDGFERGKIRITDRSGASAEIDLSYARTVDDVLQAINGNTTINVTAATLGDSFTLIDNTGQIVSNLKVQEIGTGTTAASLGLSGVDENTATATGDDVLQLFDELALDKINGGNGLRVDSALADLKITFRDGTEKQIDLNRLGVAGTKVTATTPGTNGTSAQIDFTAVVAGADSAGVVISFVNDNTITAGTETATYDDDAKTLVFKIRAGVSTADNVIAALAKDATAAAAFTAARHTGSGNGLMSVSDTVITAGPKATANTPGTISSAAKIAFQAVSGGGAYDGVEISFVDNGAITAGNETVAYDGLAKKLVFQIDAGNTSANHIIAALADDPTASGLFTAANESGSSGEGLMSVADTVTTTGGAIIEPIPATDEKSIGEVIAAINDQSDGKILAEIGPSGDRIRLTDLTVSTGGTFSLTQLNGSHLVDDLGLDTAVVGGTQIDGRRLIGGLKTSLVRNLDGGAGLELGLLSLTDRGGAVASVDLSAAETLDEVITAINAAPVGITASVNAARNGLQLTDTTGLAVSNLIAANGDVTNTADKLGLTASVAGTGKNGGSLRLQVVSETTALTSLNGGVGVAQGTIRITDTAGQAATLRIDSTTRTMGDVIEAIGHLGLSLQARINDAGDGITLIDTAHGSGKITVDEGSANAARDLHLLGTSITKTIATVDTEVIEGSTSYSFTLDADDSLDDLVTRINALGVNVKASLFNDGSSIKPLRFTLFSQTAGRGGQLLVDTSQVSFSVDETVAAKDALLLLGSPESTSGILASSASNTFRNVLPDVALTIRAPSATPVTVSVNATDTKLVAGVQEVITNFNKLIASIAKFTAFNAETNTSAVLQGDGSTLRIQTELSQLVSSRLFGAGSIRSLAEIGINLKDDGTLELDQPKFQEKFAEAPNDLKEFLSKADTGLSAKFKKMLEQLSGVGNSLLVKRTEALTRKIESNAARIAFLNARLESQRERLTLQFQRSEIAIAKIQSSLSAINNIQPLTLPSN